MGCCNGSKSAEQKQKEDHSKDIEKDLLKSKAIDALNLKLLVLGSGESGKSTVLKQIKLINKMQPTQREIKDVAMGLRKNAHQCILILIDQASVFGFDVSNKELSEEIQNAEVEDVEDDELHVFAEKLEALWHEEAIQRTFSRQSEYWILESVEYYMEHVNRFYESDFVPTEEDIVMARVMTTGIITTSIPLPPLTFSVVDVGGQRNERKKWIHSFDNVNGILFLVNLSGYDSVLFEDATQNRLEECYTLFQQTVNNPIFAEIPFYIFFNKKDLFESKIKSKSVKSSPVFSDYEGSDDAIETIAYLEEKFKVVKIDVELCASGIALESDFILDCGTVQEGCENDVG